MIDLETQNAALKRALRNAIADHITEKAFVEKAQMFTPLIRNRIDVAVVNGEVRLRFRDRGGQYLLKITGAKRDDVTDVSAQEFAVELAKEFGDLAAEGNAVTDRSQVKLSDATSAMLAEIEKKDPAGAVELRRKAEDTERRRQSQQSRPYSTEERDQIRRNNPFARLTRNLTEQMAVRRRDPMLADELEAAVRAGT